MAGASAIRGALARLPRSRRIHQFALLLFLLEGLECVIQPHTNRLGDQVDSAQFTNQGLDSVSGNNSRQVYILIVGRLARPAPKYFRTVIPLRPLSHSSISYRTWVISRPSLLNNFKLDNSLSDGDVIQTSPQ